MNEQVTKPQDEKLREKNTRKKKKPYLWLIFILFLAFIIAFGIGLITEAFFNVNTVIVCICIIVFLILLAFSGDIVAVAGAYADLEYFNAMASKKIKGAKMAIFMVKNSDRVSSILSDILGDVCAIVSGSVGASLSWILINNSGTAGFLQVLIVALVGAVISGITVCAKAVAKIIAIKNSTKIILGFGRFLSLFKKS